MIKIWLDDVREPPDDTWVWCKTAGHVILYIVGGYCDYISFDHDLADNKKTGYDLAKWIEENSASGYIKTEIKYDIHSANPVGRKNIEQAMESAKRFYIE